MPRPRSPILSLIVAQRLSLEEVKNNLAMPVFLLARRSTPMTNDHTTPLTLSHYHHHRSSFVIRRCVRYQVQKSHENHLSAYFIDVGEMPEGGEPDRSSGLDRIFICLLLPPKRQSHSTSSTRKTMLFATAGGIAITGIAFMCFASSVRRAT